MSVNRPSDHRPLAVGAHATGESGRSIGTKLGAEFVGTFFLVFTIGAATAATGAEALAPLAIGAMLMVMVFAGGHLSGAHYNPAVTVAVLIRGRISPADAAAYVVVQLAAAVAGGALARAIDGSHTAAAVESGWKALAVEFLFTLALAYVVLNVTTSADTRDNSYYGLAIGFTVVAAAYACGDTSSAAFNPAVAIGAAVLGSIPWDETWIYVLGELAGGIAAAVVFLSVDRDLRTLPSPTTNASDQ